MSFLNSARAATAAVAVSLVGTTAAIAAPVVLTFDYDAGSTSTNSANLGTAALATFDFTDESGDVRVDLSLENTSDASTGGYITAFGFDILGTYDNDFSTNSGLTNVLEGFTAFSTSLDLAFTLPPQGQGQQPANSIFNSGGNPGDGIAIGQTGTFSFLIDYDGSADDYMSAFATLFQSGGGDALARFRGLTGGGSDVLDVGAAEVIPLPATALLLMGGLGGLGALRSFRRKS